MTIDEPGVALTDYGLALETGTFALRLARGHGRSRGLRRWGVLFFGSAAIAAFAGGTDHGFLRVRGRETAHDVLWATTLLAAGGSALALAGMGSALLPGRTSSRISVIVASAGAVAYTYVVLSGRRQFRIAVMAYAPAALFLLGVLEWRRAHGLDAGSTPGIAAVVLAFGAATVQQRRIGFRPVRLDHNTLYHLLQGVSFWLLDVALREIAS